MFSIRKGSVDDIPILAAHRVGMFRDMGVLDPAQGAELLRATSEYLRQAMPRGEYLAWVAVTPASEIIGGAGVQLRPMLPRPDGSALELGPEAIVLNVYVEGEWRRGGIAEALMRELLQALAERGIGRIVLHASEEGRGLYQRLGFTPTNEMRLLAEK